MEVERALGMVVGRDNERKVRERLAVVLGNKMEERIVEREVMNGNKTGDIRKLQ